MKKAFLLFVLAIFFIDTQAQTVNGVPLKDIDVEYMHIVGTMVTFNKDVTIYFDFGKLEQLNVDKVIIKDEKENILTFTTIIDAVNFMAKNGFELIDTWTLIGNRIQITYVMKRKNIITK